MGNNPLAMGIGLQYLVRKTAITLHSGQPTEARTK
jgi:hypothetical protein